MNSWQKVKVVSNTHAAADMKSLILKIDTTLRFQAGQHYEFCFQGKNIIRKYSVVSDIYAKDKLEFGVQLIENGALSPDLWKLKEGDELETRGPIGSYFNWDASNSQPLILLGAGAGITPLISIYHSYMKTYPEGKCVFIMTEKDASHIMHYEELKDTLITKFTSTESRIDFAFLKHAMEGTVLDRQTMCFISGPDNFVDDMTKYVVELGVTKRNIKLERFI